MASSILHHDDSKGVPEEKYNLVKQRLKEMAEKNDVLTNDLNHAKKQLRRLAHEKTVLLDKLCQHENEDESMLNNESNEDLRTTITYENDHEMNDITLSEPSKKDLHLRTDDESLHHMPSLSDTLHSHHSHPVSDHNSANHQEKPPDIQRLDQMCTPHTPVPSSLWKDVSLPSLSSTILKQTPSHHHHNISVTNGSTPPIMNEYNSTQPPLETVTSSPGSSSLSASPTASSTSQSSSTDTNTTNNNNGMEYSHTHYHHRQPVRHFPHRYHANSPLESEKTCTMVPSSRPKRMRRGNQEPKMRRVQPLARDSASGEYKLPAHVGILTVHALGRVVPLTTYHNDRYIWPPGFKVSRTYLSMVNSEQNTVYTCTVEENGEQGPRFRVIAEDSPDQPIIANSATGVWTAIVKRANEIRNREHSNSASGPDYYGFTHATIAKMIQDLPGADQCLNYVWQKFGVMHQRTAAGVAAAAQKKLANLEIMGSANKRAPPLLGEGFVLNKDEPTAPSPSNEQRRHSQSPPSLPPVTSRPFPSSLPSLATMTSTAAAAAAAVDTQRNDILTRPSLPASSNTNSLQQHSLYPHSSAPPASSDISAWSSLTR